MSLICHLSVSVFMGRIFSLSLRAASEGVWGQRASCIPPKEAFLSDACRGRTEA